MTEYKPSLLKSHRNTIIFILIFTVIFGFRLYYDYMNLKPIIIPVLNTDINENLPITENDITMRTYFKINLNKDTIISKDDLIGKYTRSSIIAQYPISQKQVISAKNKHGYLAELSGEKRVIPLPADVNSSGINTDNRIEITSSSKDKDKETDETIKFKQVYVMAIVRDKIDSKGISYDVSINQTEAQRGNVPKVLMVEVTTSEAKEIEDAIARGDQINVRLVPPSVYEGVNK